MRTPEAVRRQLRDLDGRDYGAYRSLRGPIAVGDLVLDVDVVPRDPYAPPGTGVVRVRREVERVGLREGDLDSRAHRVATRDLLCRRFAAAADELCGGRRGTGWSGVITVGTPGQAILDRSAVVIDDDDVEIRVFVGFPARGRRTVGDLAATMLLEELPAIARATLDRPGDRDDLDRHLACVDDAQALRAQLADHGLVAFLADGAVLPRASGISDAPLTTDVVPMAAPDRLRVRLDTPHSGVLSGLGVPAGVTVVTGGGFHGKSTLLAAIGAGVHDHVPGDGRERCVTRSGAVPIRASSGRPVSGVDISGFVTSLPDGRSTAAFTTGDASGSTSMAAAIAEALEVGADLLLVDEDTAATNLLVRDARMQRLVAREHEPLVVLRDRIPDLRDMDVDLVLVMGGNGEYLDVADTVLRLTDYRVEDVTDDAHAVATEFPVATTDTAPGPWQPPRDRVLAPTPLDTANQHGKRRVRSVAVDRILLGEGEVDLRDAAEQLTEEGQTRTLAAALEWFAEQADGDRPVRALVGDLTQRLQAEGLDVLDHGARGRLAAVLPTDLVAALGRVRGLRLEQDVGHAEP